jgi:hypothetical protein
MYIGLHVNNRYFSHILMKRIVLTDFLKILISNFMKIHPVGAELGRTERRTGDRTDMTKLIVAIRKYANVPINLYKLF